MLNTFLKKYWVGLLLIGIFSTASYFNFISLINSQTDDSKHINISGKQRMLSQQIALLTTKFYINGKQKNKEDALNTIKQFSDNHNYLISQKLTKELQELYFGESNLDKKIKTYIKNSSNFFKNWDEVSYSYILNNSNKLLKNLDTAVLLFQKKSETDRKNLILIASLILIITIIILLLEAKFIFLPIQQENEQYTKSLKTINKLLGEKVTIKTAEIAYLLESVGDYIFISKTDLKGKITYCSDAFCKKTGLKRVELIGSIHPLIKNNKIKLSKSFKNSDRAINKCVNHTSTNGNPSWLDVNIMPIFRTKNKIKEYLFICIDKTEEVESKNENISLTTTNKKLSILASTCTLTNIYNRRIFEELLLKEISLLKRYPIKKASLIFMDIDHFKQVNDKYGHLKGDDVLIEFCTVINKQLRSSDIFARWGGEEFVILLRDTSLNLAQEKAEHLRDIVEQTKISSIAITCSFGVTNIDGNSTIENIIQQADNMLYKAKNTGRNKVISS